MRINKISTIFPNVPSQTSVSTTNKSVPQSLGIASTPDSFELGARYSSELENAAKTQEQLLKEKEQLSEQQKQLEDTAKNNESFWNAVGSFFGDDNGTMNNYQTQRALETYNEAEESSERIAEKLSSTSDDFRKNFGA